MKLQAHTLSEILVVMVITSIIVSLSFLALRFVKQEFEMVRTVHEMNTEFLTLKRTLQTDLHRYSSFRGDSLLGVMFENPLDTVQYSIQSGRLYRNNDLMMDSIIEGRLYFKGKEVKTGPLDAIKLTVYLQNFGNQNLFVWRRNDSRAYFNLWE